MMRTMTICLGNLVLFILMGLAFLFPFSEYSLVEGGFGIMFRPTVFPLLLLAYLVAYPILYAVLSRRFGWRGHFGRQPVSELSFSDERERAIVGEASKASYLVLVGGLIVIIPLLGGVKLVSDFSRAGIDMYVIAVAALTVLLAVATVTYGARWYCDYRK